MNTLKEQRMVHCHKMGIRDYHDGHKMVIPRFLSDSDERAAYEAGYLGAAKRDAADTTHKELMK